MASDLHQRLVKLKGRENYDTWKIAAKSYLVIKDLWSCVKTEPDPSKSDAVAKDLKAWSELSLLIHENLYSYIANTTTAMEAWKKLESAFEDSGLCRKVELLKQLVQMTLEACDSVEEYVSKMVALSLKVQKAGLKIDDEMLASLMLAGLPDQYKSLVMAIENSSTKLTSDAVKTLLLQETRLCSQKQNGGALSARSKSGDYKFRCHNCGKMGHIAKYCEKVEVQSKTKEESKHSANVARDVWKTGL